jgi:colanic acid/amylovoran biosynthesis glycosyltransferase
MEALAQKRPVVATAVGGIPELVRDGMEGRLVAPGDANALADAIAAVLRDPEAAERMGDSGREMVAKRHDPKLSARRMRDLFLGSLTAA